MDKQERMQRVRVGLTGLAAVLVVVAAAAAVFESAGEDPAVAPENATATTVENMLVEDDTDTPNEPLAEIGVAPAAGPTEAEKEADAKKGQGS